MEKYKKEPLYLISSSVNKVESSIIRGFEEVFFLQKFGDDPEQARFNSNLIRKFWENIWTVIKTNVSEGVYRAHLAQTAHSEKTAHEKFLFKNGTRDEGLEVLEIYSERLLRGQEDEVSLNKTAPAVNEVEPDFEADPPSPSPERPTPSTSSPYQSPVTRFPAIKSSLKITPRPLQPASPFYASHVTKSNAPRESINSTFDEENENSLVTSYLKSLKNFRVKPGKPIGLKTRK